MDESVDVKSDSVTPEETSSAGIQETDNEVTADSTSEPVADRGVSYSTHRRLLREKKKQDELINGLQGKLDGLQMEKMEKEGEYRDAYVSQKEMNDSLKKEIDQQQKAFAWNILNNKIKSVAVQSGMKSEAVDMFVQTLNQEDLEAIEMDNLDPNLEDIKRLVENKRKSASFMFGNSNKAIDDLPPSPKVEKSAHKKASLEEMLNELRRRNKEQNN